MSPWWQSLLLVAAGGAFGGLLRHGVSGWIGRRYGENFPWGTWVVNTSGAFALGYLLGASTTGGAVPGQGWLLLGVGVLGSYTTVSSLSLQTLLLAQSRQYRMAGAWILLSLLTGIAAAGLGLMLSAAPR
ncbi:MAG: CrcB family protein [Pseudomonadota bacterium]|nr:CrcB family protein [Pseudomonadota bacterium]